MGNNNKPDIECLFKHNEFNVYAVGDVLNQLDTTKTQSSFWNEL